MVVVRVQGVAVCKSLGRGGFTGEPASPTHPPAPTAWSHPLLLSASLICLNFIQLRTPQTQVAHPRDLEVAVGLAQARKTKGNLEIRRKSIKVILLLIITT